MNFNTIPEALEDLRQGKIILVTDDPDRENEGDFICAAEFATTENINFMATHGKGLICMPMSEAFVRKLQFPQMVQNNTDNHETAFTVSIDHVSTTTGISAEERGITARACVDPDTKPEDITLIGDSAGGNLAAALSIMARDRGEFMPKRQILIYPAVNNDYSEKSLFSSVRENGQDYLLTAGKLKDYINLYAGSEEDKLNPYFAPILEKDLSGQPDTLILTSEFDPLRDEGEAYGRRLAEAGNRVEVHRIKDALHGYFALGIRSLHVQESFEYINHFLEGE